MKSILYVGAALMIGASVYGFVDYNHTKSKREFKELYTDREIVTPAPVVTEPATEVSKTEKVVAPEKKVKASDESNVKIEAPLRKVSPAPKKNKHGKKKLNLKEFSRARIG